MNNEQVRQYFRVVRHQMAALEKGEAGSREKIDAVLQELHRIYEQMQTTQQVIYGTLKNLHQFCKQIQSSLDVAVKDERELTRRNYQLIERLGYYYNLFQSIPVAYLITDRHGVIREANQATAQLLNVPRSLLPKEAFISYVAERDRPIFHSKLNQLHQGHGIQVWPLALCPRTGQPFDVELCVNAESDEELRIGVQPLGQSALPMTSPCQQQLPEQTREQKTALASPSAQPLNGLRVLVVDDEADIREFIAALLETQGICVKTVANAAIALEELGKFQPDVLLSDIRMPGGDGYSLMRHIRAVEARQGGHIPSAAMTAYSDEDRTKALNAGYETHLHKLAQPDDWIKVVAQLAGRSTHLKGNS